MLASSTHTEGMNESMKERRGNLLSDLMILGKPYNSVFLLFDLFHPQEGTLITNFEDASVNLLFFC